PVIFTMTPYIAEHAAKQGVYFAQNGYVFVAVDSRGRSNSEGTFIPGRVEAKDGYDAIEWVARQPWCDGQGATWGGAGLGLPEGGHGEGIPAAPQGDGAHGVGVPRRRLSPVRRHLRQLLAAVAHLRARPGAELGLVHERRDLAQRRMGTGDD